jgi:5-formyltetrahydrofolate cyclo-ligase
MLLKSINDNNEKHFKKDSFRKKSLTILKNTARLNYIYNSKIVCEKIKKIVKSAQAKAILLYLPLENEVDVSSLIKYFRKRVKIYVPFMECVSFKLVKYRLPVQKKKFNVKEPFNSFAKVSKIDIAIVPVIGVDGDFRRVGFGKGMYDRFFASLHPKPLTIFVQLAKCFTTDKLCEYYDVQADIYVTPSDITIKRGKNVLRVRNRSGGGYGRWRRSVYNSEKIGRRKLRDIYDASQSKSQSDRARSRIGFKKRQYKSPRG